MSGPVLTGPTTGPAGAVRFPAAAAGDVVAAAAAAGSSSGGDPPAADRNADEFDAVDDWDNLEPPPGDGWGHTYHNDRRYHLYMAGRYPFPNDRQEQTREHIKHLLMMALTDGRLSFAPLRDDIEKIIDIGTGTGIWALEMSDLYPNAQVLGTDLSPIQPVEVPENLAFIVDDCEAEWANGSGWDFVHARNMCSVLQDVERLIQQAYAHMKPGGWIELKELHVWPRCDDGTMGPDDIFEAFSRLLAEALEANGMDMHKCRALRGPLTRAGFTNIQLVKIKSPIGEWHDDPMLQYAGGYQRQAILGIIPAICGQPFESLGIGRVEREAWAGRARRAIEDDSVHRYFTWYFWTAQKPEEAS